MREFTTVRGLKRSVAVVVVQLACFFLMVQGVDGQVAKVVGRIWLDANKDGLDDGSNAGEGGLRGVLVRLVRTSGPGVKRFSARTNANGRYRINVPGPRNYLRSRFRIQVRLPGGFAYTTRGLDSDVHQTTGFSKVFRFTRAGQTRAFSAGLVARNCKPSLGELGFAGLSVAYSMNASTLSTSWEPAGFISNNASNPLDCDDPVYDVFIVKQADFDFTPFTVPELMDVQGMIHRRTSQLALDQRGLTRRATYSVLVTASAEDKVYSENRVGVQVVISHHNPVISANVKHFVGYMVPEEGLTIRYFPGRSLLLFKGSGIPDRVFEASVGDHLAVETSRDEDYYFKISGLREQRRRRRSFLVEEQQIHDVFDRLFLDVCLDPSLPQRREQIGNSTNNIGGRQRRTLERMGSIFDTTVPFEKSKEFGSSNELIVTGKGFIRAYLNYRVRVKLFRERGERVVNAVATLGGEAEGSIEVKFLRETDHEGISLDVPDLWTGPSDSIKLPGVWYKFPVVITWAFSARFEGLATAKLDAAAQVTFGARGEVSWTGGYGDDGWFGNGRKEYTPTSDIEFGGEATLRFAARVVLLLETRVNKVIGVDVALGAEVNAISEVALTPEVLRQVDPTHPLHYQQFDVDGFILGEMQGRSIFGNLGDPIDLFDPLHYELLRLPEISLGEASVADCQGANAIELSVSVIEQPYTALIDNTIGDKHLWIGAFDMDDPRSIIAREYSAEGDETRNLKLTLPRSAAANIGTADYSIPSGYLWFRTSPRKLAPALLPYMLITDGMFQTLFGSLRFECCQTSDCHSRYPFQGKVCVNGVCVEPSTVAATTLPPSDFPSAHPSAQPSAAPSVAPSGQPIAGIITAPPTKAPSTSPSSQPSGPPTLAPSPQPSAQPSVTPTVLPSFLPSTAPSADPSIFPTVTPSSMPSLEPSAPPSNDPSTSPSVTPSRAPSLEPSILPSVNPTATPSTIPSQTPSAIPSQIPSIDPTILPTTVPSSRPSFGPSPLPSLAPSGNPAAAASAVPSAEPSQSPSMQPSRSQFPSVSSKPSNNPSAAPSVSPSSSPIPPPSISPSTGPSSAPSTGIP